MAIPAPAADRVIVIPAPPPPDRVLNKVGGFFHRLFNGDKDSSSRRSRSHDNDDDEDREAPVTSSVQSTPTGRTGAPDRSVDPAGNVAPAENGTTRKVKDKPNSQSTVASTKTSRPNSDQRDADSEPSKSPTAPKPSPSSKEEPSSTAQTTTEPATSTSTSPPASSTTSTQPTSPAADAPVAFAKPIPGKPGFVYPPGVPESMENVVDVIGFKPGQVVRDPRTKVLFRVP